MGAHPPPDRRPLMADAALALPDVGSDDDAGLVSDPRVVVYERRLRMQRHRQLSRPQGRDRALAL